MEPKFDYRFQKKFVGSRPDEVKEFFNLSDPSIRTRPLKRPLKRNEYQKQKNNMSGE
jgi:hypothetical protein